jgi:preprotein translocase subunit SecD
MVLVSKMKAARVALVCAAGLLFAMPNMLSQKSIESLPGFLKNTVNLGLELRGGSHLQFEVDLKSAAKDHMNALMDEVRSTLRKEQIGYTNLSSDVATYKVTFALRQENDREKALQPLRKIDQGLTVTISEAGLVELTMNPEAIVKRTTQIVEQSIEVIRRRIDETGTKEPNIQRQGTDRIIVQLPGVEDPAEVKRMIGKTAKLTFRMVDHDAIQNADGSILPSPGSEILTEQLHDGQKIPLSVKKEIKLTGDQLVDAQATTSHNTGGPAVSIKFNNSGARKFADISTNNVRKRFAIILDDLVISAPVFNEPILTGDAIISGSFTIKEANDLSLLLRAGSLPAPLKVVEESSVGPSLGADSIKDGQHAVILAFILVSLFMIAAYSLFGFIANIALIFNLVLLFAGLSILGATLTLPGIAGIALTIGMAVDANVLIYERIKEELRLGSKALIAIEAGYKRAMTTIIDSNLTTLLGAAVLYEFGSGPIRGFAVTLALGILISLFTALSLTKVIIAGWFGRKRLENLPI